MPEPVQTAVVMGTATLPNCQSSTRKYMAPKLKRTGRLVFKGQRTAAALRGALLISVPYRRMCGLVPLDLCQRMAWQRQLTLARVLSIILERAYNV